MRLFLLCPLVALLCSCNAGNSYQRSYVITKSHEAPVDTEATAEQLPE